MHNYSYLHFFLLCSLVHACEPFLGGDSLFCITIKTFNRICRESIAGLYFIINEPGTIGLLPLQFLVLINLSTVVQ